MLPLLTLQMSSWMPPLTILFIGADTHDVHGTDQLTIEFVVVERRDWLLAVCQVAVIVYVVQQQLLCKHQPGKGHGVSAVWIAAYHSDHRCRCP